MDELIIQKNISKKTISLQPFPFLLRLCNKEAKNN